MKKKLLAFCLALAAVAPASAFAFGVDLTWRDCVLGTAGTATANQTFNCASGPNANYNLYFQVKPHQGLPDFVAFEGYADLGVPGGPLAPHWQYNSSGCAGSGSVKGVAAFDVIPPSCQDGGYSDFADGDGSGATEAIASYTPDYQGQPGVGHFVLLDARSSDAPMQVDPGVNYFAIELRFNNRLRTACAGCTQSPSIVFNLARLAGLGGGVVDVSFPDKGANCATVNAPPPSGCDAVPVQNTSWGKIKSLYR